MMPNYTAIQLWFFVIGCFVDEQATFERPSPDFLQVSLTGSLRSKVDSYGANVMVALYENGLITDCPKGENQGRVLSSDFVVRRLEKLSTVKDVNAKKTISGTLNFPLWEGFNPSKCGLVLFVQNPSHQIFGSQNFQLPDNWHGYRDWIACVCRCCYSGAGRPGQDRSRLCTGCVHSRVLISFSFSVWVFLSCFWDLIFRRCERFAFIYEHSSSDLDFGCKNWITISRLERWGWSQLVCCFHLLFSLIINRIKIKPIQTGRIPS